MDLCGLGDKIRDLVLDQILKQLLYLFHYNRNIKQLYGRLDVLIGRRCALQRRIDVATNNADKIEDNVRQWMLKVDEISKQVDELHRKCEAKLEGGITSCPNPWLRYKLSKRAEAIAQEADKIYGEANFIIVSYHGSPQSMPELTNRESNEGIDSRVEIKNHIMEALRNPRFNMIGLCGLGGVGKTTIAKDIEMEEKNQKVFEKVIMATVSREMNIGQIQDQIIDKLGMQLHERSEDGKASRLYRRLENERNMLLILDDLWQELDLGKVGIPFGHVERCSKSNEGCKILLTSRNEELLSKSMKCQKVIKVGVLSEDEAWELFQSIAKLSIESSSPDLKSIATEIVQKCGGLPLAIATAAKALKDKNIVGCRDYLARLKHPLARSFTGIKEVDTILKLSYEPLSRENKVIFLLSAMLSHDPSIEDLLMYSVGLDILKHIQDMGDARNAIFDIVGKLKSLNLFLDSFSSHHFTMHDVFRDVALSMASEELNAVIVWHRRLNEWPDESDLKCCKGICLQESDICDFPEELQGPILEFFLLNSQKSDLTIPNMFFKSSKELKVLAITNVHFSSLPSLSFLRRLKALCLHSCLLEDITEIRSLRQLKALSLAYSEIERLPGEVAELTSLQMLNLSHCSKLKVIPQNLLSSLKKLEVLYMGNSFNQWKVEESSKADENASLDELMDLPISSMEIHIPNLSMLPENLFLDMNLKRYKIFIGKCWEWQDSYETSKILKLQLQSSIHLKRGVQKLFEGVEDLYLYGSNAHENVLHNHEGRGFPHLRHLQIDGNYGIRSDVSNSAHHEAATKNVSNKTFKSLFGQKVLVPGLKILELSNLNCLIPLIWDGQLSHNSFSNLRTLIVRSCGFVKLVPLHMLKFLNNLEELDVEDCDMLEKVFDFEDLNDYKEMESSPVVVPLKKLKLRNLPKLKNVWSDHYQGNVSFPSLRSVDVSECKNLTSIFPAFIAKGMLCELEELQIQQCGVEVIVAKDQVSESAAVTFGFPRLTSLLLSGLPNLRNFYPQKHILEWPDLNQLSIQCCDELEIFEKEVSGSSEIYEEENMLDSKYPLLSQGKVIGNLEKLRLQGKEVEKIGSGQFLRYHFPKLKLLHLSREKEPSFQFWERSPNLGQLKLSGDFEKAFGGDNVAALAACFPKLTLEKIFIMGSLSPSLVSSPNLTHLNVKRCDEWTTLMTSSIARSLIHLTHLSVGYCRKMEEILTKQEGEDDKNKEIIFIKLKFLELEELPRLKSFCAHNYTFRFLLLDQVIIKKCPKFKIFSSGLIETPSLKSVQLWEDWKKHHEIWDIDLNETFYRQRLMVSREVVLDEDDAIMIRNEQFPADCYPQVEILQIKGFVEEWVTFPYALLERFPKMNELHVENCSFTEIFPSHATSSTPFHNLTVLKVSECHHLIYLVTCSTAKSLVNLETLEINDCVKLEEIVRNEADEDVEGGITFIGLRILKLTCLPRLKTKEEKRDFNIGNRATNTEYTNISGSLFSQKKVLLPKLETLELSNLLNSLVSLIWDDQLLHNSFSNLKTLTVKGCDFMKSVPLHVLKSLNNLEKLEVKFCDKLEMVFGYEDLNDKEMESSSVVVPLSLTHLEVTYCCGLTALMMSSAAPSLVHITHLSISYCDQIEEIITKWEGEDDEDKEIFFNKMKLLELENLPRLKRFCRHNYTFRFPLLDELVITGCPKFKTFSPGLTDTPSLQSIHLSQDWGEHHEIWDIDLNKTCCQQRYVTSRELVLDDEDDARMIRNDQFPVDCCPQLEILRIKGFVEEWFTFPYTLLERFPKLNELHVENCSFEEIFPSHAPSSTSFHNLAVLKVSKCHQLVYLVTCSTVKSLVNLETLEVDNCEKMEEIVRNDTDEDAEGGITFNGLKILKLTHLPNLKTQEDKKDFNIEDRATNTRCTSISRLLFSHNKVIIPKLKKLELSNLNSLIPLIWDDQLSHNSFNNLKILTVNCCGFVKLIPFHVLKSLNNLEELDVKDCYMLEKVFDFEDLNDYKEMELSSVVVPLKKLKLRNLPKLKNVWSDHYQGNVSFPSLWSVDVFNCKNLTSIFSLLSHDKVIGNLERLTLQGKEVEKIGSGQFLRYHFPKLKLLHLSLEKEPSFQFWERFPNLGELKLTGDFGGDDVAALAVRFPKLTLEKISIMGSLSPSLVSSPNLTHLNVKTCDEWTTLMTSSIARSLVHLTHLSVGYCRKMEEIVTKQEGEDDENKEIIFIKLKFLELDHLTRLKRFCAHNYTFKFLLLDQLIIKQCPKFKIFSPGLIETPSLKSVQLWEDWEKHHEIWDTDLKQTFYRQRYVTSRELVLYEDDAIMIRDDQFPADCCPQVEILGIEGFVEEWVTFPYTLLKRFPKLNALHVENCSFEEIIPSQAPSSTSFHNLTVLKVFKCHQLVYLVTCSTVKSLVNLETLEVDDCEKMEGIVRNETDENVEWEIIFNALRILKLARLPKLKTQKDKKDFNIEDRATNTRCTSISKSLFNHNKVLLPKLEILELSNLANNSVSLIWDDQLLHNSFSNVKTLIVKSCEIMKSVPLRVLKSLTNLEKMEVSYCHKLEKVFGFEDLNDYHKEMESSSVVVPLSLTHLEVKECRGLTSLMMSSAAPSLVHITHLSISSCSQIEEIITKEGEDDEDKEIFFNKMKFLKLGHLPRLKRFCGYNYTFKFSLLKRVTIIGCPQLTMFCPGAIHAPQLQSVVVSEYLPNKGIWMSDLNNTIQHLFTFEEVISTTWSMALNGKNIGTVKGVFPEVLDLYVTSFTDEGTTFPYSFLERFPQLNELYVEHCSFGEIFPSQDQIIDFMVKISPFKDLRRLSISGCHQLIYLITTSTAKSLVGLRWLEINACKKMEEIVMNETNEDVESGITFDQLQKIKLTDMPSLKLFSSQNHTYKFPELEKIKITGCPKMKMFCHGVFETPKLSKVKIEEHGMEWKDEGDLNKTIEMLSPAKGSINV